MEVTYLAIAGTVIAVAAIYYFWARKVNANNAQHAQAQDAPR